jgi:glycosyltransferase involved in cell wall biosynthesis
MTLFWIAKIAKKYNIKTILFFRETLIKGLFGLRTSFIKRNLNLYVDRISFISEFDLVRNSGITCNKRVIYNINEINENSGEKNFYREKLGLNADKKYILYVGGLYKLKGAHVLIKAAKLLKRNDVDYIFLGIKSQEKLISKIRLPFEKIKYILNFGYENKCMKLIVKYNLLDKIKFFPPQTDTSYFYSASDILVYPMTSPHQARPIFEAGINKTPIIITDFPNIKEFINEKNGFLFQNEDYQGLAKCINFVLDNNDQVNEKVEYNYQLVKRRHSYKTFHSKIKILLEEFVN